MQAPSPITYKGVNEEMAILISLLEAGFVKMGQKYIYDREVCVTINHMKSFDALIRSIARGLFNTNFTMTDRRSFHRISDYFMQCCLAWEDSKLLLNKGTSNGR